MRLLHDVFLRADVFLLPRVHDVALFQNLHGERFGLLTFELHLDGKINGKQKDKRMSSCCESKKLKINK